MSGKKRLYHPPSIHPPSASTFASLVKEHGLDMSEEEQRYYHGQVCHMLGAFTLLQQYPEATLPTKYLRIPGYRPAPPENKHNAWFMKTSIQGSGTGKLVGKKVVIKDSIPVAGVPLTMGSTILKGFTPEYDSTVVTRVLDEGGEIPGTATCESICKSDASFLCEWGPVLNPIDPTRSAGGSSSGCAVLVATGEVDMAIGGDQGGSIRLPASFCGIVGLKPTWGLVPCTGIATFEPVIDHVGPMASNVKDCALLLEALAGYDNGLDPRQPRDLKVPSYTKQLGGDLRDTKVGILIEGFHGCETGIKMVVQKAVQMIANAGATIADISVPMHKHGHLMWLPIMLQGQLPQLYQGGAASIGQKGFYATSLSRAFDRGLRTQVNQLPPTAKAYMLCAAHIQKYHGNVHYGHAMNLCRSLTEAYDKALQTVDVLVMPTSVVPPPKIPAHNATMKELMEDTAIPANNLLPFNVTGHPALSINAGFSEGLPVGMMIVGKHWHDATVLRVAHAFEQIRDGAHTSSKL